jgi:hypothetical protein
VRRLRNRLHIGRFGEASAIRLLRADALVPANAIRLVRGRTSLHHEELQADGPARRAAAPRSRSTLEPAAFSLEPLRFPFAPYAGATHGPLQNVQG